VTEDTTIFDHSFFIIIIFFALMKATMRLPLAILRAQTTRKKGNN